MMSGTVSSVPQLSIETAATAQDRLRASGRREEAGLPPRDRGWERPTDLGTRGEIVRFRALKRHQRHGLSPGNEEGGWRNVLSAFRLRLKMLREALVRQPPNSTGCDAHPVKRLNATEVER